MERYQVAIIGAGPAGMTAALYACRAGKSVLLIDGQGYGGQILQSHKVENYPGAPDVSGMELAEQMMSQLRVLGLEPTYGQVNAVRREAEGFSVGDSYEISFSRTKQAVPMTLSRINDAEGAQVLLLFSADSDVLPEELDRAEEIVVKRETVEGLLVPMMALVEGEDGLGVWVEEGGVAVWRDVEPLVLRDGYCLAPLGAPLGALQQGDRILVTPRRLHGGMAV